MNRRQWMYYQQAMRRLRRRQAIQRRRRQQAIERESRRREQQQEMYNPNNKRALLIGINYIGTTAPLNGCINDIENMQEFLQNKRNYLNADITLLSDGNNSLAKPTKTVILAKAPL